MPRLPSRPTRLLIVIAVGSLCAWFVFDREHSPQATSIPEAKVDAAGGLTLHSRQIESLDLKTEPATAATTIPISGLPAEVAPPLHSSARVAAPYAGVVTRVLRDEGDLVAAGDALVRIQSRDLLAARADLLRARSEAGAAAQQARRNEILLQEGIIAATRSEESQARAAAAEAAREQAEGALSGLRVASGAPGEYELLAPIAGRVLRRLVVPGQAVAALEETHAIAAPGSLDLLFTVAVGSRSNVVPGRQVRLQDGTFGSVVAIGADTDRASQRLRVRARVDDDGGLVAGQHVEVTLLTPAPPDSVAVPDTALLTEGDGYVLYVRSGESYRAAPVERLGGEGDQVIVRGEVKAGEQVVVRGASALKSLLTVE